MGVTPAPPPTSSRLPKWAAAMHGAPYGPRTRTCTTEVPPADFPAATASATAAVQPPATAIKRTTARSCGADAIVSGCHSW